MSTPLVETPKTDARASSVRPRTIARLRKLMGTGRAKIGGGLRYWQVGGATRSAAKRAKRP